MAEGECAQAVGTQRPMQPEAGSLGPRVGRPAAARRAMMLLLVLTTLMLAVAVITPLATLSGVEAVTAAHRAATLRHRLAAESLIATLPELLQHDRRLRRDLDRLNRTKVTIMVGEVRVTALVQDDTAKLPLPLLFETGGPRRTQQALASLQVSAGLPALELMPVASGARQDGQPRLSWSGCLDDLFVAPTDAALFSTSGAWTHYVTPLGSAVQIDRAEVVVLEALLADLQPGLGQRLATARDGQSGQTSIDEMVAMLELPEQIARDTSRRLTRETQRYSLLIRTEIGDDVRQRYVICAAAVQPQVLVNWEVAP